MMGILKRKRTARAVAVVLMYHRILPDRGEDSLGITVSLDRFRAHLEVLKERYHVVGLDELIPLLNGGSAQRKAVAITFDDGYRDNFECAFPALKAAALPAAFFVPTDRIGSTRTLFDERLRFAIKNGVRNQLRLPGQPPMPLAIEKDRHLAIHGVLRFLHPFNEAEKEEWLKRLNSQLGSADYKTASVNLPLTWDQLRAMREQGMIVGSHGRSHRNLATLSGGNLQEELLGSARSIEKRLGQVCRFFSYPYGRKNDVPPRVVESVRRAGYLLACTASQDPLFPGEPPWSLRGLEVSDWPEGNFIEALEHTFRMETHTEDFCI